MTNEQKEIEALKAEISKMQDEKKSDYSLSTGIAWKLAQENKALRAELLAAKEVIEFYGDKSNWLGFEEEQGFVWSNEFCPHGQDYENTEGTCMTSGKRARRAIDRLNKFLGDKE